MSAPDDAPKTTLKIPFAFGAVTYVAQIGSWDSSHEYMSQFRMGSADNFEDFRCAIPVLYSSAMNYDPTHKTESIGDNMTFTSLDPFACIIARYAATFRVFMV